MNELKTGDRWQPLMNPPHVHNYQELKTDPGCITSGELTYTCDCGDHYTEELSPLGHLWDDGIYTEPAIMVDGFTTYICTRCETTNVIINEGSMIKPELLILTLNTDVDVVIHTEADLAKCCTTALSTTPITVGEVSFKKNQVVGVKFGKDWNLTVIPKNFLYNYSSFNQPITIPEMVTKINEGFLMDCTQFNSPLTIHDGVTELGHFLINCPSFNQPITFPKGVIRVPSDFLRGCHSFNQQITLHDQIITIGRCFLSYCYLFNQPIDIPNGVKNISMGFLEECRDFNQPLILPKSLTSLGYEFLKGCENFNQPITIPDGVTRIERNFLERCISFNSPLILSNNTETIEGHFLFECESFNQPLNLPNGITRIEWFFLNGCRSFNKSITIPSGVPDIGPSSFVNCDSFVGPLNISKEDILFPGDEVLSSINNNTPTYMQGVRVCGLTTVKFNAFRSYHPNRTTTPFRKIINGGPTFQ